MSLDKGATGSLDKLQPPVLQPTYVIYQTGGIIKAESTVIGVADITGTNPTTVINSAIAALTSGGTVYLKQGVYNLTNPIVVTNPNITLMGEGKYVTVINGDGTHDCIQVSYTATGIFICDMHVTCGNFGVGINLNSTLTANFYNARIERVVISYAGTDGLYVGAVGEGYFSNILCDHCGQQSAGAGFNFASCDQLWLTNLESTYNASGNGAGFFFNACGYVAAINLRALSITNGASNSIYIYYPVGNQMFTNIIIDDSQNGIRLDTLTNANGFVSFNQGAFFAISGSKLILSGCTQYGNIRIKNFEGYNPVGSVATPWPASAGPLLDSAAAQNNPTTATVYTVSCSPKLIILSNTGGVTQVQIDGVTLANVTTLADQFYRLEPGQTIKVTWATTTPNGQVFAQ